MQTISKSTRAEAWLAAANMLRIMPDKLCFNLIVEITEPATATLQSRRIESLVDKALRDSKCQPLITVAETIFPATEYKRQGLEGVYNYADTVHPFIKPLRANRQNTYAYRLVRRGTGPNPLNPLKILLEKMRVQLNSKFTLFAAYELDLCLETSELKFYDVEIDRKNTIGGQCLSHVSLKLGPDKKLYMTAMYRSQYFVQKALGNYKGLANLQACIARELGIAVGPLVVHATMARLEDIGGSGKVNTLLTACEKVDADLQPA